MRVNKEKLKLVRTFSLITLFLAPFSLFSFGFSSWVFVLESQNASKEFNLDLDAGNVGLDTTGILTFPELDTTLPTFGPDGFYIDGIVYNYLTVDLPLSIKIIGGIDQYLVDKDTFKLSLKLYKNGTFPLANYPLSTTYFYDPPPSGGESFVADTVVESLNIFTTITFKVPSLIKYIINNELNVLIKYKFDFSSVSSFEEAIYTHFIGPNPPTVGFIIHSSLEIQ